MDLDPYLDEEKMKYTILEIPDPVLKEVSVPVTSVGNAEKQLLKDMLETMYAANGVGLAAPQIGISKRIIVIDIGREDPDPICLVNPEFVFKSEETQKCSEGCLSVPNQYADVKRHEEVHVKYLDEKGAEQLIKASGYLAIALQHEIDHLDGIIFIDYLSPLKRKMLLKRLDKKRKGE